MQSLQSLAWYGILVVLVMMGFVLIPYICKRSDLATAFNATLIGIGIYVGIGCFDAAMSPTLLRMQWRLGWFIPTADDIRWCITGTFVFISALLVFYYYNPVSRRLGERVLQKWPPLTPGLLVCVLLAAAALIVATPFVRSVTFVGPLVLNLSQKACSFAPVFAFTYWYRRKSNLFYLGLFLAVFAAAAMYSMMIFNGRRMLMTVFLGPILVVYWTTLRNWRISWSLTYLSAGAAIVFMAAATYSTFRHFNIADPTKRRDVSTVIDQIQRVNLKNAIELISEGKLDFFSQSNVQVSMLVHQLVASKQLKPEVANSLAFIVAFPIPRKVWASKPETIGHRIGHKILGLPATTNWGVGVAGHGAFEGGLAIMVFYAFLLASGLRLIDTAMARQPTNPFLIGILTAAIPHLIGFARGDFGIMSIETLNIFAFAIPFGIVGRMFFGTAPTESPKVWVLSPKKAHAGVS